MQDSIIVYRNPGEKFMWEQGGFLIVGGFVLSFFIVFGILYYGLTKITGKGKWKGDGGEWILPFSGVSAFITACWVVWHFMP